MNTHNLLILIFVYTTIMMNSCSR